MQAACQETFTGIYHAISRLVLLAQSACGQAGVGNFSVVSCHLLDAVRTAAQSDKQSASNYVASAQQGSHSDAAMALAQGNS